MKQTHEYGLNINIPVRFSTRFQTYSTGFFMDRLTIEYSQTSDIVKEKP